MWFSFIFFSIFFAPATWAQDVAQKDIDNDTPRARIVKGLTPITTNAATVKKILAAPSAIVKLSKPRPVPPLAQNQKNTLAPFYLTAKEYHTLRGDNTGPQTVLFYNVVSGPLSGSAFGDVQKIKLIIGNDYVAMHASNTHIIYDFKLNRILTLKPIFDETSATTKTTAFENTSLFAKAYRNINTVRQATQGGNLQIITLANGQELDGFWVESAMSWASGKSENALNIKAKKQVLEISKNGGNIFTAKFTQDKFSHASHKDNLLAFAHNQWPLHPDILMALSAYETSWDQIKMVFYNPKAIKGQTQEWTLSNTVHIEAGFPLPMDALSTQEHAPISPLALAITAAARGKALGGTPQLADLKTEFQNKNITENMLELWVLGQQYNAYTGVCDRKNTDDICAALNQLQSGNLLKSKRLQGYIKATHLARNPKTRGEALKILTPNLLGENTPAFIWRTAALARAKMKPADIKRAGVEEFKPETLLELALIKDPYDPNTYIGLAQILAAKGAFEQSWDVYDTLRAGILTQGLSDKKIGAQISKVEINLRAKAPGYFLGLK